MDSGYFTDDDNQDVTRMNRSKGNFLDGYVAVLGKGMIRNNILLPVLLNQPIKRWYPWYRRTVKSPDYFAGWGEKKSYRRARKAAKKMNRPVLSIEDGFLRSIDSGINSRYGCSVVVDDIGIYFNLHRPSLLETHICNRLNHWKLDNQLRSGRTISKIIDYKLSKYNSVSRCPTLSKLVPNSQTNEKNILVVDQVMGDASIKGSGASPKHFKNMLKVALQNHPNANIWIKAHPAGKSGYLNSPSLLGQFNKKNRDRIHILDTPINAIALLEQIDHVYTVSSHMGFEALMLNKPVYCFGVSWYAGWGLTNDVYAPKKLLKMVVQRRKNLLEKSKKIQRDIGDTRRNHFSWSRMGRKNHLTYNATLEQLFYAAYIDYSHYADPASNQACEIEQTIEWLHTNRNWYLKLPKKVMIYEFSRWKIHFVKDFLAISRSHVSSNIKVKPKPKFKGLQFSHVLKADLSHDILVWGLAGRHKIINKFKNINFNSSSLPHLWCMEDGFIRSNGLGATLLEPMSVVMDSKGIYYDATMPSDLENLIAQCGKLNEAQSERVEALHTSLINTRVSKYNVGNATTISIPHHIKNSNKNNRVILIVGQVEDDLSVQYCGSSIKTNSDLIKRVRQNNPEAYLIFKPHPDVEAGLRVGSVHKNILNLLDDVAYNAAISDCLEVVDEVHTISSLTGFEALLRYKKVCCYGLPFYAGWGLTYDMDANEEPQSIYAKRRRQKRKQFLQQSEMPTSLSIDISLKQLIYCTLIQYPMYRLPKGYGLAQVEQVVDYLYINSKDERDRKSAAPHRVDKSVSTTFKRFSQTKFMQIRHRFIQQFIVK